jgi:hypothetical protein
MKLRKLFSTDIKHCIKPSVLNGSEIWERKRTIKG